MLEGSGLVNPKWELVSLDELDVKCNRSNCTLAGEKLWKYYDMPSVEDSLEYCIKKLQSKWEYEKV